MLVTVRSLPEKYDITVHLLLVVGVRKNHGIIVRPFRSLPEKCDITVHLGHPCLKRTTVSLFVLLHNELVPV
jgi:hypothetical protein